MPSAPAESSFLFCLGQKLPQHRFRSRRVARCSFYSTKMKKKKTIYLWLCTQSFSPRDGCSCAEPSRSMFPLYVRWGFLKENQTKSDKRSISPGMLTTENCDVFCPQQPRSLVWTLGVTSLETIWDCAANVFVHVYVCPLRESIMSVGVDWWDRRARTIFVSSITVTYSKWFFNKLRGDG